MTIGAEQVFDVVGLEDGDSDFLACVIPHVEVANGYLLPSRIVINRNLNDALGITFNGGHLGSVGPKGRCGTKTGQVAYSAQCVRVQCVEIAGEQVAQVFWDSVVCDEIEKTRPGTEPLTDSQ